MIRRFLNAFGDLVTIWVVAFFIMMGVIGGVFITSKSLEFFIESLGVFQ
jgi:uncharacterized protein YneF (UPF0154 family)